MIRLLKGKINFISENYIILETAGGTGYQVFLNSELLLLKDNDDISIFTHTAVRENSITLFGFLNLYELDIFEMLITVSGVGPKVAMNILSISTPSSIKRSIVTGETSELTKVSGIGKRVAEKIILELKNKIDKFKIPNEEPAGVFDLEIYETLENMGFSKNQIRETLENLPKKDLTTEEKIKESFKLLAKNN
jgi:Holliday junction DNA helicase RuvA